MNTESLAGARRPSTRRAVFRVMSSFLIAGAATLGFSGCGRTVVPDVRTDSWQFSYDTSDVGIQRRWFDDSTDRSGWMQVRSGYWADKKGSESNGVAWYASTFDVQDTTGPWSAFLGGADDDADVWVDGQSVGSHEGADEPFALELPSVHAGRNSIVVRVVNRGGPGGLYKPVQIVRSDEVKKLMRSKYADERARPSADWVRNAVIYEVYLRSFSKEGTFKGLQKRLQEIKDLGVNVVWLMPIHPVGMLARKGRLGSPYSVQDYYGINPEFGTLDDFKSLVAATHRLGMKIIIDLVANHTSWDSRLLIDHSEWFRKNAEGAIVSPNADWTDVAQLDYRKHELRKYMIGMMEYWVRDIGIDGYRCDVADMVPIDFWDIARDQLDKIKPVMMLAEGKRPEDHLKAFDLTYSWNLYDVLEDVVDGKKSVKVLDDILTRESDQYPNNSLRLRFDTNHDKTAYDGPPVRRYSAAGAKATAALVFTYPGVPLVYTGEEIGNPKKLDLFEKTPIDWTKGKEFRTLFQTLGRIRAEHPALSAGSYARIWCSDSSRVFAFERSADNDSVTVVINFSDKKNDVVINGERSQHDLMTGAFLASKGGRIRITLPRYECAILVPQPKDVKR